MKYKPSNFSVNIEEEMIADWRIAAFWNGKFYRIILTIKNHSLKGESNFTFSIPK
jgi:hypothetical protein